MSSPLFRVIIATPRGMGGRGGMDRLSDAIKEEAAQYAADIDVRVLATYGPGSRAAMPAFFLRALLELAKLRASGKIDLLHINVAGGASTYRKAFLALWARCLGIPYVIHLHGSRFRETWPTNIPLARAMSNAFFLKSESILVLGKIWGDYLVSGLPALADKIRILPNATRSRPLSPDRRDPTAPVHIAFIGLLGSRKGSLLLIEALSRLDTKVAWKCTIAGNGDVAAHREVAMRLGVADRVTLPGWLGPADVDALLDDADMLVLPSFAENLPMVIIEAFAHGVPVVATPVGAIAEVVEDGVSGFIVPVGDVAALTAAIQTLVETPTLRRSMGAAARASHAKRFRMEVYIESLVQVWRQGGSPGTS